MATTARRRRRYMAFEGGPIDGGVEVLVGEDPAPLYYVHRVMGRSGETAFHRYVRAGDSWKPGELVDGKEMYRYEHEGSVRG